MRPESPICIACGCDEQHACDGGCGWLRFDATALVGVCSQCEDLVRVWDASRERRPLRPLIAERFHRQVLFLYDEADARAWVTSPQQLLGGRSPRDLILAGELDRVRRLIDQLATGAFL